MIHIRSAIVAGFLAFGTAAVASAQAPATTPQAGQHQRGAHGKRGGPEQALFRGIQLSDAEKANVKAVNAKYAPQMKALRQQFKSEGKIAKGDTAAMHQRWEANAPQREQMKKLLEAERVDLRAALTPANQTKFDANAQRLQQRAANRVAKGKGFFSR